MWLFVVLTIASVELLADVPGATLQLERFSLTAMFATYGLIFGLTWFTGRKTEGRYHAKPIETATKDAIHR